MKKVKDIEFIPKCSQCKCTDFFYSVDIRDLFGATADAVTGGSACANVCKKCGHIEWYVNEYQLERYKNPPGPIGIARYWKEQEKEKKKKNDSKQK